MRVHAILLAAGTARRFGGDKLRVPWRGRPLIEHALEALTSCPRITGTVVVVNPGPGTPLPPAGWAPAPPAAPPAGPCTFVINPDHLEGMASSLRAGVAAVPADAEAYLVALADMPGLTARLAASVVDFAESSPADAVVPTCDGRRGHPVLIRATLRERLLEVRGDQGARSVLAGIPERVALFETGDPGVLFDVDTPADLEGAP